MPYQGATEDQSCNQQRQGPVVHAGEMLIDPNACECSDEHRESHEPANQAQHAEAEPQAAVASSLHPQFACCLGADCPAERRWSMGIDFIVHVGPPGTGGQTLSLRT